MLKVSARLDLKIWADLPSCWAPSVGTRTSCNLHWRFRNRFGGSKKKGYIRQQKPSCDRSMAHSKETSSQQSLGDAAGAKEDTTAKAISPHNAKRNESRGFPASWGIVSKETVSMEAQRPEAACECRVAARFDFAGPRLNARTPLQHLLSGIEALLSSFTRRSQVNQLLGK